MRATERHTLVELMRGMVKRNLRDWRWMVTIDRLKLPIHDDIGDEVY